LFCVIAIGLLLWAIDAGQYEDLDKEAWKILSDEDPDVPYSPGKGEVESGKTRD